MESDIFCIVKMKKERVINEDTLKKKVLMLERILLGKATASK